MLEEADLVVQTSINAQIKVANIFLSSGYKNLSASWQNQIVSVRTAAPTASYSTTLWERTSTDGYGKGVVFKHADWYGQTANLNNFPTSAVEVKSKT